MTETNWSGNLTFTAPAVHRPSSLAELQSLIRNAPRVHLLGSRHSFNAIADSAQLITLADLPQNIEIATNKTAANVPANITYGVLAQHLDAARLALPNMASLPHVSVAGAVATGTHGSGDYNGSLATAVSGIELVTSDGELVHSTRGEKDFEALVVNLGALGAVTRLVLDVQPSYQLRQTVFENLSWSSLLHNFDAVTSSGYSVSLFTNWGDTVDQLWLKTRISDSAPAVDPQELFGARAARTQLHPLPSMDPTNCTPQLGSVGPWWTRLTHFRVEHQPSAGDELHAEYMLDRRDAPSAIDVVRSLADRIRPLLMTSEIRTVAADNLWLSPMYQRDSVCLHFTWYAKQPEVEALLPELESALERFAPRPHWGKLFAAPAATIRDRYPRLPEYLRLKAELDPRGAFTNDWFNRHVSETAT